MELNEFNNNREKDWRLYLLVWSDNSRKYVDLDNKEFYFFIAPV